MNYRRRREIDRPKTTGYRKDTRQLANDVDKMARYHRQHVAHVMIETIDGILRPSALRRARPRRRVLAGRICSQ